MGKKFFIFFVLLSCFEVVDSAASTTQKDIYNAIISGYTKEVRPVSTTNSVLNIGVMGYLLAINDFDEVAGTLETVLVLGLQWTDEALTWSVANYNNVAYIIIPQSKIWAPELFNVKSADTFVPIGSGSFKVSVMYNGDVQMMPGGIMKIKCSPDVAKFPFDVQTCSLEILPWMYMSNDIVLSATASELDFTYFELNGEWTVMASGIKAVLKNGYPFLTISITLKRLPLYHIVNTLIPVYFLGFLNPLVFIMPCDSGERSGFTLTMLLSYTVFMMVINASLPQTSSPMAILSFVTFGALVFSGFITILNNFQLRMYHRDENILVPNWLVKLSRTLACVSKRKVNPGITAIEEHDETSGSGFNKDEDTVTWKRVVDVLDIFYLKADFAASTVQKDIYNAIISGYTKEVHPMSTSGDALNISISGYLIAINNFDEVSGTLEIVVVLSMQWVDEALVWDLASNSYMGAITIPQSKIWAPELFNVKAADSFEAIGGGNFKVTVAYNGYVYMSPGGIMKVKCTPDVTKFPFDVQNCYMEILPWMYTANDIVLSATASQLDLTYYEANGEWTVMETRLKSERKGDYFAFVVSLKMKRIPLYHIVNTVIPMYFLGFLNPLVFILPCDCGERSGYTLTMLLSYTVFMMVINAALPQTSNPMAALSFVTFGALLFNIDDYNSVSGVWSLVAAPNIVWKDDILTWTPSSYGGIQSLVVNQTKIWRPNLYNVIVAEQFRPISNDHFRATIFNEEQYIGNRQVF
ncbi:uncharacterized protein LOC132560658 [Ylistrum balloti]|uniref:uncharacterized protein LOC132560658 n=1 Tax=Ylistrum balloti TaxID=509963 RepID=UPI002905F1A3|nr:uncharacterized protein LOC132560658 [Ylistrum balloti]